MLAPLCVDFPPLLLLPKSCSVRRSCAASPSPKCPAGVPGESRAPSPCPAPVAQGSPWQPPASSLPPADAPAPAEVDGADDETSAGNLADRFKKNLSAAKLFPGSAHTPRWHPSLWGVAHGWAASRLSLWARGTVPDLCPSPTPWLLVPPRPLRSPVTLRHCSIPFLCRM